MDQLSRSFVGVLLVDSIYSLTSLISDRVGVAEREVLAVIRKHADDIPANLFDALDKALADTNRRIYGEQPDSPERRKILDIIGKATVQLDFRINEHRRRS